MNEIKMPVLPQMNELLQKTLNWQPDESQQQQFQRLYELIVEGNRSLNLTRITEPVEFWEKHLWDSLRGVWSRGLQEGGPGYPLWVPIQELDGKGEIEAQSLKVIDI